MHQDWDAFQHMILHFKLWKTIMLCYIFKEKSRKEKPDPEMQLCIRHNAILLHSPQQLTILEHFSVGFEWFGYHLEKESGKNKRKKETNIPRN